MNIKKITEIINLLKASDITEFKIESNNLKLHILKHKNHDNNKNIFYTKNNLSCENSNDKDKNTFSKEEIYDYITSPMVGTFYQSSSPENENYVFEQSSVTETSIVCIIDAMKVMNEIQSGINGIVEEILVKNGDPVEFNQKLFKIRKI